MSEAPPATLAQLTGDRFFLLAGPCVIESEEHSLELAGRVAETALNLGIPLVFKASFDKANRTSIESYRGPGMEAGLKILGRVRREVGLPIVTDIHLPSQAEPVAEVADILQIPAFLCRQTDLIVAAARTGRIVNLKKGQFMAPQDMEHAIGKARQAGADQILVTERGASFGYNNLVVDFKSLSVLRGLGAGVVFDATHSVQLPGGAGGSSGGQCEFIADLARAAVAVGIDGLFVEVHEAPERALSDGTNALPLNQLRPLLEELLALDRVRRNSLEKAGV